MRLHTNVPADEVPLPGAVIEIDGQPIVVSDILRGVIPQYRHLELHALNVTPAQTMQSEPWSTADWREQLAEI